MFRYIVADQSLLSTEDKQTYQSFYCGLCRQHKKLAGAKGQKLKESHLCFLAILLNGLYETDAQLEDFRCMTHPAKKKQGFSSEAIEYTAAMDILLSQSNRKDYDSIKEQYPRQATAIEAYFSKLSFAQCTKETNVDIVSSYAGEMLAEVFNWKQDEWSKSLHCIGYYLGKFIYIMNAFDDIKKDEKKGDYNPLLFLKKESPNEFETFVKINLLSLMNECTKCFENLPITENLDILRNILYIGVWKDHPDFNTNIN